MSYTPETKKTIQGYASLLANQNFDFFATFTTNFKMTKEWGYTVMSRYFESLKQKGFNPTIFYVIEPFTENGYHLHVLIKLGSKNDLKKIIKLLKTLWRRISKGNYQTDRNTKIEPYIPEKGANYYVSKFLHHENVEYDLLL